MIIGITGTDGAGKGAVVEYLKTKGFVHYSSRDFLVAEIEKQGLPIDRNHMRLVANELRARFGNEFVVKQAYEKAIQEDESNIVIESIRASAEADYLQSRGGILLAVDADPALRYERVQGRRSASDKVSFEQFITHEELEKNDPDPNGMQKAAVIAAADHTIMNDGTIEELHAKVEQWLQTLSNSTLIRK